MSAKVTAVVVSYADPAACSAAVDSLLEQSSAPIEILVLDNDPAGATALAFAAESRSALVQVIHPGANLGYTGAANLAGRRAKGDWLFFLNPDALAARDCLERLLEAVDAGDVAIVGAQVLLPDGRTNAGENPINLAGVSWAGGYGEPREHGPARDTAAVSGAALMVKRETFLTLGGLCPHFFMYYDDVDLAWRTRLSGMRVRYCPQATVIHAYEFDKGPHKWFHLERNRVWALLGNLKIRTLLFLTPVLIGAEALVIVSAIRQGWLREKLRSWRSLALSTPRLLRWRRLVQMTRSVSDYAILTKFSAGIQTQLIDTHIPPWVNRTLERYRRLVLRLLKSPGD